MKTKIFFHCCPEKVSRLKSLNGLYSITPALRLGLVNIKSLLGFSHDIRFLSRTIMILFFLFSISAFSQDLSSMKDAFTNSYAFEKNKDYSKAITEVLKVYDEKSYETNLRLGWLYYENGAYTTSVQYYEKAVALMPYSIEAKLGYILPEKALGNMDLVKAAYEAILKIDPQNSYANYNLGLIYYNNKDYQSAYTYLEKIANMYPFDYDITILYAWTNFQLSKLREAKILFTKTLLINPGDTSATEGLSLIK